MLHVALHFNVHDSTSKSYKSRADSPGLNWGQIAQEIDLFRLNRLTIID